MNAHFRTPLPKGVLTPPIDRICPIPIYKFNWYWYFVQVCPICRGPICHSTKKCGAQFAVKSTRCLICQDIQGGHNCANPPHGLQICSNRLVLIGLISVLVCPPEIAINVVQDQLLLEPLLPLRDDAQVKIHGQGGHLHTGHLSFLVFDKISTPFQLPSSSRAIAECRRGLPLDLVHLSCLANSF